MKQLYLLYPLIIGFAAAYFISGIVVYKLRPPVNKLVVKTESSKFIDYNRTKINTVVRNNIFGVNVGASLKGKKRIEKVAASQSFGGYSLVGFTLGKSPMALFKKRGKPLVIIDKKTPFDKWILSDIINSTVYLKNEQTGQVKRFVIKMSKAESEMNNYTNSNNRDISRYRDIDRITIRKSLIRRKLTDFNKFLKNVQINPYFRGTKTIGYRISYLNRASILNKIGLKRGDIIVSVNGKPTSDTLKMMNLYSQLSNMTSVNLNILRNGTKKTIFVEVE